MSLQKGQRQCTSPFGFFPRRKLKQHYFPTTKVFLPSLYLHARIIWVGADFCVARAAHGPGLLLLRRWIGILGLLLLLLSAQGTAEHSLCTLASQLCRR